MAGIQAQSFKHRSTPASAAVLLSEPTAPLTTASFSPSVCRGLLFFTGKKSIMWQRRGITRSESHMLLFIHGICKFHQNTVFPLGGHQGRNNTGQVLGNRGHLSTYKPYMLMALMFKNFLKTKAAQPRETLVKSLSQTELVSEITC